MMGSTSPVLGQIAAEAEEGKKMILAEEVEDTDTAAVEEAAEAAGFFPEGCNAAVETTTMIHSWEVDNWS